MKLMHRMLLSILCIMPQLVAAAEHSALSFSPPESDVSVKLLQHIFGLVDGVLYGTGSQIVGEMLGVFNAAILVLGAIVLMYSTIMSISNTANEGQTMGQKYNSVWLPIRSVAAVALLIPKASGYCTIQIFAMWVVVQGIGAADTIWSTALEYLERGGVIVSLNLENVAETDTSGSSAGAFDAFKAAGTNVSNIYGSLTGASDPNAIAGPASESLDHPPKAGSIIAANPGGGYGASKGVGPIFYSIVCMHSLQSALEKQRNIYVAQTGQDPGFVPSFSNYITVFDQDGNPKGGDGGMGEIQVPPAIPGSKYNVYAGVCGTIKWENLSVQELGARIDSYGGGGRVLKVNGKYSTNDPKLRAAFEARALAVQQMLNELSTTASSVVLNYSLGTTQRQDLGHWSGGITQGSVPNVYLANNDAVWQGKNLYDSATLFTGYELQNAALAYIAIISPTLRLLQGAANEGIASFTSNARKDGWILAGSYFFDLVNLNNAASHFDPTLEEIQMVGKYNVNDVKSKTISMDGATDFKLTDTFLNQTPLNATYGQANFDGDPPLPLDKYIAHSIAAKMSGSVGASFEKPKVELDFQKIGNKYSDCDCTFLECVKCEIIWAIDGIANQIIGAINWLLDQIAKAFMWPILQASDKFYDYVGQAFQPGKNPIIELTKFGVALIDKAMEIVIATLATALFASLIPGVGIGLVFAILIIIYPIILFVFTLLVTYGAMFAFYIPLIPYIVFTFASIAWFVGVIETMVAAPIVALGLAHPEGHDSLGKAEQSVMMLANVFLRPSLMIIGFVIGIILSYVGVWLLNAGFSNAAAGVFGDGSKVIPYALASIFIIKIYLTLMMEIVQKSFDLVHILPDKVLRWVGGGAGPGGGMSSQMVASAAGDVKSGVESGAAKTGELGGAVASAGGKIARGTGKAASKVGAKIKNTRAGKAVGRAKAKVKSAITDNKVARGVKKVGKGVTAPLRFAKNRVSKSNQWASKFNDIVKDDK